MLCNVGLINVVYHEKYVCRRLAVAILRCRIWVVKPVVPLGGRCGRMMVCTRQFLTFHAAMTLPVVFDVMISAWLLIRKNVHYTEPLHPCAQAVA